MSNWVVVCTVLIVAQSVLGAELTHRWSFNGDYSDSVGGVDAVKCGTYVSLYGGRVGQTSDGYVRAIKGLIISFF